MAKLLPVVDGEVGGDVYGYASTERGAKRVAGRTFADPIAYAYRTNKPFTLRTGERVPEAFVAVTKPCADMSEPLGHHRHRALHPLR